MFYKLIENKRDEWLSSSACTVRELLGYIVSRGQMRDAQVEAIKTYLYLKIACGNAPLWFLFTQGVFNTLDFDAVPLSVAARRVLCSDRAAAALFEYSRLRDRSWSSLSWTMRTR